LMMSPGKKIIIKHPQPPNRRRSIRKEIWWCSRSSLSLPMQLPDRSFYINFTGTTPDTSITDRIYSTYIYLSKINIGLYKPAHTTIIDWMSNPITTKIFFYRIRCARPLMCVCWSFFYLSSSSSSLLLCPAGLLIVLK
jgi:hypothetical protein